MRSKIKKTEEEHLVEMLDLGEFALEADKYSVIIYRKRQRKSETTGEMSLFLELVGHYANFAQAAARLAHMSAAEAVGPSTSVKVICDAVVAAAARMEAVMANAQVEYSQIPATAVTTKALGSFPTIHTLA